MARKPSNFSIALQLSTTPQDIVTAAADGTQKVVTNLAFFNTSTTDARTVTVYRIPDGGSASTATEIDQKVIQPRKSWEPVSLIRQTLENGQFAQAVVDAGTDVNANCSGDIFS